MTAPSQPRRPFAQNSIIWERKGPLPVWGWMALILLLLLGWAWWRRARARSAQSEVTTGYESVPGNQQPPAIFLLPQPGVYPKRQWTPNDMPRKRTPPGDSTVPPAPPGGGAPPPQTPPPSPVVVIPDTVTAPADYNLYNWSQEIEAQYGLGYPVIERAKAAGKITWRPAGWGGADPQYGNVPTFTTPTPVRIK